MQYHYTIVIQWSNEDQCYIVLLPEFENVMQPVTYGDTYEEALKNAQKVLELLLKPPLKIRNLYQKLKRLSSHINMLQENNN